MSQNRWRILVADEILPEGLALLRTAPGVEVDDLRLSRAELLAQVGDYQALIVRSGTPVDRELIEHGIKLQVVGRAGLALDNIDVAAATERGIMVLNTPDAYSLAAAEHTHWRCCWRCAGTSQRPMPLFGAGAWERERFLGAQLAGKSAGSGGPGPAWDNW